MRSPSRNRRGSLLIEICASAALLATLLTLTATALVKLRQHVAQTADDAHAMLQLENSLEQITAQPWEAIADDGELAAALQNEFNGAQLRVEVVESDDPLPAKQVTLSLLRSRPLRLTTWVHRQARTP